jgi:peptidoglycan/LPS O-acetylase OafA/YrhL
MPKTVPVPSKAASTATGRPPNDTAPRTLGHLRGLDGLRAIAVLAVVIYHADLGGLTGGFLGVEVFFVISGYLITALLLAERGATGRIDPVAFWVRRGRRLLPALFAMLLLVLAFAMFVVPDELSRLRADALAAVAYVTNWHLIAGNLSYFESIGRPSLFNHLWSLAIEEQFYLVWPLALGGLLLIGRRTALATTLVVAALSAVWMAIQFDPATDPSRVYYGTDTRLTGLLLGSALAFVWVPSVAGVPSLMAGMSRRQRRRTLAVVAQAGRWGSARQGWGLDLVGVAALVGLGAFLANADAFDPFLYQGGLAALAVVTVALIAAVVHPRGHLGRLLEVPPIRWIGTRSYSIYLWHWPIFALTRPGLDVPLDPGPALAVRLVLTAVVAELSYRFVEMPLRTGALARLRDLIRSTDDGAAPRTRRWPAPAVAGGLAAVLSVMLVSVAIATPPSPPDGLTLTSIDAVVAHPDPQAGDQDGVTAGFVPSVAPTVSPADLETPEPTGSPVIVAGVTPASTPMATPSPSPSPEILAFGESVMIPSADALAADLGPLRVDAAVGRHIGEGIDILRERQAAGELAGTVIIQLGNNGPFRAGQFDAVMATLRDVPLVVWVNLRVPRDWEAHNNRVIESGVARYPNARLVDWYDATAGRPDLFWKDGYHPRPKGAKLYADLIAAAVR